MKRGLVGGVLCGVLGLGGSAVAKAPPPAKQKAAPVKQETLTLKKGEVKDLSIPGVTRIALGDTDVADVERPGDLDDPGVRVTALKAGKTQLLVWTEDGVKREYTVLVRD